MEPWMIFAALAVVALVVGILTLPAVRKLNLTGPGPKSRPINTNAEFFVAERTAKVRQQMAFTEAQLAQEDQIAHAGRRQQEKIEKEQALHEQVMSAHELHEHLTAKSKARDVSLMAHDELRIIEETGRIRLADRKVEINQDIDRAERLASVEIKKENDLMKMYIWTSRVEKMFGKEIQAGLQERIFEQIEKVAQLRADPLSESRTAKLAVAEMLLNSWVKELDELTRGKKETVSSDNREEHRGLETPTEPPTSNTEDD